MRAVTVSVNYSDLLRLTIRANRKHFDAYLIITSPEDALNVAPIACASSAEVYVTDLFYRDGADFAKWRALEACLDMMGRWGWVTLLDCDIILPKTFNDIQRRPGYLYTPLRRMQFDVTKPPVVEDEWYKLPLHQNVNEWAGYCQTFHMSEDYHLGSPPWHETNWSHCGGADSFFQRKWEPEYKVRPPYECLHLGYAGQNWYGRSTQHTDGSFPIDSEEKRQKVRKLWADRHKMRGQADPFINERIKVDSPGDNG